MDNQSSQRSEQWNLVFVRYGDSRINQRLGSWMLLDSIFLVEGSSRAEVLSAAFSIAPMTYPDTKSFPPSIREDIVLSRLGIFEIVHTEHNWEDEGYLGESYYAYSSWSDFKNLIIDPHHQSTTNTQDYLDLLPEHPPKWYLAELSYASQGVSWIDGGVAIIQQWHLIHASSDEFAYFRAIEEAPDYSKLGEEALAIVGANANELPFAGLTELIPIRGTFHHGSELGCRTFGYDQNISWNEIVDELDHCEVK